MGERNPSDEAAMLRLRVSHEMRQGLKSAAKANNRTMNAEVVARLEGSHMHQGIGLRDKLAGEALNGLLASDRRAPRNEIAAEAYAMADAMLAARGDSEVPQDG